MGLGVKLLRQPFAQAFGGEERIAQGSDGAKCAQNEHGHQCHPQQMARRPILAAEPQVGAIGRPPHHQRKRPHQQHSIDKVKTDHDGAGGGGIARHQLEQDEASP